MKQKLFLVFLVFFFILSCDDQDSVIEDDNNVSYEDSTSAAQFALNGNTKLESILTDLYNEENEPTMSELSDSMGSAYADYSDALELNPNNLDANFGIALTGLLHVIVDPAYEEMLENWEEYFDTVDPFKVNRSSTNVFGSGGIGLPLDLNGMVLPIKPILSTPIFLLRMISDSAGVAKISDIQNIVENNIMPYVNAGIDGLSKVQSDTSFVFKVTSDMQPDVGADPMELDMTEVYLIDMMLHALKAIGGTIIGHNFDMHTHDETGLSESLTPGSDFATLRTMGGTDLAEAHQAMIGAVDKLNMAMDFLEAETDDQDNDMIPYDAQDASDFENIRQDLNEINDIMTGPKWFSIDEGDSIQIDIQQFYINPLEDLKEMVPPYLLSVGTDNEYVYPVFTWEADNFQDWKDAWPDPTINGIFSNMSIEDLLDFLEINEENWKMTNRW